MVKFKEEADASADESWVSDDDAHCKDRASSFVSPMSKYLKLPLDARIDWCDYEEFKNRFSPTDGRKIIQVLGGHPDILARERRLEVSRRKSKRGQARRTRDSQEERAKWNPQEERAKWIHRVRIQSPTLLYLLGRFSSEDWDHEDSRTFLRPFQSFYYSLAHMRRCLRIMENQIAHSQRKQDANHHVPHASVSIEADDDEDYMQTLGMPPGLELEDVLLGIPDAAVALQHVKIYVRFVEDHVVPMWKHAAGTPKQKVRFMDLPMYYLPGELVTKRRQTDSTSDKAEFGRTNSIDLQVHWKLTHVSMKNCMCHAADELGSDMKQWEMSVEAYHIDFDGEKYVPVPTIIEIKGYEGEKDIQSLQVYPMRFDEDVANKQDSLRARGERFASILKQRHVYYDGWTMIYDAFALEGGSNPGDSKSIEHIEGEIIIDFEEGFQSDLGLSKPLAGQPSCEDTGGLADVHYSMEIHHWADESGTQLQFSLNDVLQYKEGLGRNQHSEIVKRDDFLQAYEERRPFNLRAEDLILLPPRLIAYSFRARKFFVANIDFVSDIRSPKNTFRNLKIHTEHKRVVRLLVKNHFQKQKMRRLNKDANLDQDFIRGKGSGLIILLHGVPGVGKTTTAEAVAISSRRPLFSLTSGDLGSTPREVEQALRETFRLATLWDCVLLLDEADLFLVRRDVGDLERNSLVSVFLRVLDYYNGVLFLTTNRVGTIDEAFKSRIHYSIYYPRLQKQQTLDIFKLNMRRLREIEQAKAKMQTKTGAEDVPIEIDEESILDFARQHWENTAPHRRWNGRQIRNAFQIAYSLVHYDRPQDSATEWDEDEEQQDDTGSLRGQDQDQGQGQDPVTKPAIAARPRLDRSQFLIVSRSIDRFDRYLDSFLGSSSDRARTRNLRNDAIVADEESDYYGRPEAPRPSADGGMLSHSQASRYREQQQQYGSRRPDLGQPGLRPARHYYADPGPAYRDRSWDGRMDSQPPPSAARYDDYGAPPPMDGESCLQVGAPRMPGGSGRGREPGLGYLDDRRCSYRQGAFADYDGYRR